ncbi:hypothetical protein R6U77_00855 [Lysinibacillus louembei]|uniref:Uncharacterized protein n=1 Tax=Lysinibacillus louembei TaxID=1470088 RepID=A0ABZ0RVJ6_9BACI|nr:hypothetical protein [Lysinibacillus louembei]WPK12268.1 hypothetical protein R6U77_00855 [Lysinibacillus louembei]
MGRLKFYLVKLLILLLCVPAYPFLIVGVWMERSSSTLGVKFRDVNADYWDDTRYALSVTYKKSKFYKKEKKK